jgi:hypothetical protein
MVEAAKDISPTAASKAHDQVAYFLVIFFILIGLFLTGFWPVTDSTRRLANYPVVSYLTFPARLGTQKTASKPRGESRRDLKIAGVHVRIVCNRAAIKPPHVCAVMCGRII